MNALLPLRKNRRRREHERRRARWNRRKVDLRTGGGRWGKIDWKRALRVTAILALLIGGGLGLKSLGDRLYFENPHYQLRDLTVETDGHIPRGELIEIAGIGEASNLLLVPLGKIGRRLGALPAVKSVSVNRTLPGELTIRVAERTPVAWLQCEADGILPHRTKGGVLLDAEGIAFSPHSLYPQLMALPVIDLKDIGKVPPGTAVSAPEVAQMLELIGLLNGAFYDQRLPIRQIRPYGPYGLHVSFASGAEIIFGRDDVAGANPLASQTDEFFGIVTYAKDNRLRIGSINLMPKKNIPAVFIALNDADPTAGEVPSAIPLGGETDSEQDGHLRAILGPLY